jgi:asparagine synthase (glutamine-hydrolysing)
VPGLVGYVSATPQDQRHHAFGLMVHALETAIWHRVSEHSDSHLAIARVGLGVVGCGRQPVWSRSNTICVLMEGEFFGRDELEVELEGEASQVGAHADAEVLLRLYEKCGPACAERLNGAFHAAIWEPAKRKLSLLNDRFGLYPLYYAERDGLLLFACGVRALLAHPSVSRRIDPLAIAQMLTFEQVLGDRTLIDDVKLLPPASWMTFEDGRCTHRTYWKLGFPQCRTSLPERDYREGLAVHLRQATRRQCDDASSKGVLLSGGLDSRVILGGLRLAEPAAELRTFTFGLRNCDDARFAGKVANAAGTRHQFDPLAPDFLQQVAAQAVRLTDGMTSGIHMHVVANLERQAASVQVLYKGYMGDALMGSHLNRMHWAAYDHLGLEEMVLRQYTTGVPCSDHSLAFTERFLREVPVGVQESFAREFAKAESDLVADWMVHFDLRQRQRRFVLGGVELARSQATVRTPFCDNDLVEYMLAVPPGLRYDRYLCAQAFVKMCPELAKIPMTGTNRPLLPTMRTVLGDFNRHARWTLRNYGFARVPVPEARPYADYNGWLRTSLRRWVEDTLLNARALGRGYFNPPFVRATVEEHMAGRNHATRLGVLLTIELWHRQFMD